MKLGRQDSTTHHGLWARGTPGDLGESSRHGQNVEMPLQPGTGRDDLGTIGLHVVPAHLRATGSLNRSAQGSCRDLSAKTDGEEGNPLFNRIFHEFTFSTHRPCDVVPVHTPL